jgi:riboflavin biosynthesis pyrimidine reductase
LRRAVTFERLAPAGEPASAHELLAEVRPRERAPADRPFVYVNFVATIDGRAAVAGRTGALGSEADLEMLLELRVLADALLIGTGTLRAEGYARLMGSPEWRAARAELGLEPDPPAVLISRGLDLPWDAGLFAAPEQPVLVYTGARGTAPDVAAQVEVVRLEVPSPAAVLADLRRRGIRALGCEGGPLLFGSLVADDLVDELFFTLVPMLTGEDAAPRIVEGGDLPVHVRAAPLWVLRAGDELFLRYGLSGAPSDRTV